MALTEQQAVDVRRYMGYPVANTSPLTNQSDDVYGYFGMRVISLFQRLILLSASEEAVVVSNFLSNLAELEADIYGVRVNLDTDKAAVWTHNKAELRDRRALYSVTRRELCAFLGFEPGPGLGCGGGAKLVRA
jgi:hypothetical protein